MKALILALFLLSPAYADEPPRVVLGAQTICDTEVQWQQVWDAHKSVGYEAAKDIKNALSEELNDRGEPACGVSNAAFVVVRVIDTALLEWPDGTYWTEFVEYWSPRFGVKAYGVIILTHSGT